MELKYSCNDCEKRFASKISQPFEVNFFYDFLHEEDIFRLRLVLTKLDTELGLAQPQLVIYLFFQVIIIPSLKLVLVND